MPASWLLIVAAGLLVGFGARLGGGCTSGHGVCGIARLSARSIAATAVFMASAIVVVAVMRHVLREAEPWRRVASFVCGLIFGFGLLISGMTQPAKVLGFLDVFGRWDPSLAVRDGGARWRCRARAMRWPRRAARPLLAAQHLWPSRTDIDRPLVVGSVLFGIGWGLVGLCPGPALDNLATSLAAGDRVRHRHGRRNDRQGFLGAARVRVHGHQGRSARDRWLEHDPEKWEPVSRLREARFGGRRKVGKDHAQTKS